MSSVFVGWCTELQNISLYCHPLSRDPSQCSNCLAMENDRRHEKSWNDPPLFSMEQLNKASSTVPLSKRYRYPQAPAQAPNQMYQQQPNVGVASGYGFQTQPALAQQGTIQQQQQPFGQQQQQQQYPATYSSYGQDPNAAAQGATNYPTPPPPNVNPLQQQQYSQYAPNQLPMAPNAYPSNPPAAAPVYGNNPNQPNYNIGQYANNQANYSAASQFVGQAPAQQPQMMNPNYQSQQPYNPQARY